MRIDVLTLFPEALMPLLRIGVLGRALEEGLLTVSLTNPRDFAHDRRRTVDDTPYGGGAGMVMRCEPLFEAAESLIGVNSLEHVILLSPRGRVFNQQVARDLSRLNDMVLICARYEGVDERVSRQLVTDEISIGVYVLSGGVAAALVVIEAVRRMLPGVVGVWESVKRILSITILSRRSTQNALCSRRCRAAGVLEGNHAAIQRWRRKEALRATVRANDLLKHLSKKIWNYWLNSAQNRRRRKKENKP